MRRTPWPVLPDAAVRDLAAWLSSWAWPLDEAGSVALAQRRGWTPRASEPRAGSTWDTHLVGTRPWASVSVVDDRVSRVRLVASESFGEPTTQTATFVMGELVRQLRLVSDVLDEPSEQGVNDMAAARWRLASGATLLLGAGRCCFWTLSSPRFAGLTDRIEARDQG